MHRRLCFYADPGNSGGPALKGDRVVGVAFQHLPGADNIGYIIPTPIVNHFLEDIRRHECYTGFVRFGFFAQALENPHLREYLRLPADRVCEGRVGCGACFAFFLPLPDRGIS